MESESWPRISMVTPSYNQGDYLEETICSVLDQGYPNLEYYVVDGGSEDQTVNVIREYKAQLSGWVSEPDHGQSDAISKGLDRCTGVLFNWINSDDVLQPGALHAVAEHWMESENEIIAGWDQPFRDSDGQPEEVFHTSGYTDVNALRFWTGTFQYHQPPTFLSLEAVRKAGGIDTGLHYAMDYDLYCRVLQLPDVKVGYLPRVLSGFRLHNQSKTSTAKEAFVDEMSEVSRRYWPPAEASAHDFARELRSHRTRCFLHQAVEAGRAGGLARGAKLIGRALREDFSGSVRYSLNRFWSRGAVEVLANS